MCELRIPAPAEWIPHGFLQSVLVPRHDDVMMTTQEPINYVTIMHLV